MEYIHDILDQGAQRILGITAGLIFLILMASACARQPILTNLDPTSGPPGTAVQVQGSNLLWASVRWDANTPAEKNLPSSFLSASFFTVPLAAVTGNHLVRLYGDGKYSVNSVNFNATTGTIRPNPRLDDITVNDFQISQNQASMILMASGANIDVGSQILVNGVAQGTSFSRLLRNTNMQATNPATLGYPIFHYATVWCVLSNQTPGSNINVSVKNLDGAVSNTLAYRISANMNELDSDGDGLPDIWEKNGYDANNDGIIDVPLPSLGANPMRKDLFVEVDWMNAAAPNAAIWTAIEDAFANAPVLNPDGSQGITIHIDRGQAGAGGGGGTIIPYSDFIRYDNSAPTKGKTYANFYTLKTNNFNANRLNIYRYCIFAWDNGYSSGASGQAEEIWANDFIVSLGSWGTDGSRADFQTGTFIHELGHTLNLRHGGFEDTNSKDNYNSIMQYGNNWIIWNSQNNKFSPSQFGGIDTDCNLLDVDAVYTYSQGMRADLNEANLNENIGVCDNVARDWNGNGIMQPSVSVNLDTNSAQTIIRDYADWANIKLNFRATGSNWGNN